MAANVQDLGLIGLQEAARYLQVGRARARELVLSGALPASRLVDRWYVRTDDLETFAKTYERPQRRRVVRPQTRNDATRDAIARLIGEWQEATAAELATVVGLHPGNVRKHLVILEAAGVAERVGEGLWRLTQAGERYQEARARSA